ncbi:MAG: MTH1187 family thiamine-binding protein [Candidatus Aminicenantes bacterium]|nr:MTH1187 family thiamine-binding protein [Candidatus Aminicenantes bacterium]NLH77452.1 MTH1187 family thiamine-binding protein [Acidobacteriota bacterium]
MVVEFSVVPVGGGEELAGPVARILDLVDRSGLPYRLTAMGTIVEGSWDEVLGLVRLCHETLRGGKTRVLTHIAIDDRPSADGRIEGKVRDVEAVLGRRLKT